MDSRKQMYKFIILLTLTLFSAGFSGCRSAETDIEAMALQYLSAHYSAEFSIADSRCVSAQEGNPLPIPHIIPSYKYELEIISDQFPEKIFHLYYQKDSDTKKWEWSDDYYTLLLDAEAQAYFSERLDPYLDAEYVIDMIWSWPPWPAGTGEGTSFEDWLRAGGRISVLSIYLNGIAPSDEALQPLAAELLQDNPAVSKIIFKGLTSEAFSQTANMDIAEIWNSCNQDSQLGRLSYFQWNIHDY